MSASRNVWRTVLLASCVTVGALATFGGTAHAQQGPGYRPPPPPTPMGVVDRRGLTLGIGLGGGAFAACSDCSDSGDTEQWNGVGVELHIGGMLNQRLAIMFDGWGVSSIIGEDSFGRDVAFTHVVATGALQYWLSPQFWIKGGIGVAQASIAIDGETVDESEQGGAISGAIGFEILQAPHFALDLQLRLSEAAYSDTHVEMASFLIAANWY